MGYSTFKPEVEDVTTKGFHTSEALLYSVLTEVERLVPAEATNKIYAAALMAAAPIKFMATMMAAGTEAGDKKAKAGKETMLIAALIVARMAFPSKDGEGIEVNFTPRNVLAAIEAANKIAGRDLYDLIDHRMIDEYRDGTAKSGTPSLAFWDYLDDVGPAFDDMSENMANFVNAAKTRH